MFPKMETSRVHSATERDGKPRLADPLIILIIALLISVSECGAP